MTSRFKDFRKRLADLIDDRRDGYLKLSGFVEANGDLREPEPEIEKQYCVICDKELTQDRPSMMWVCPLHGSRGTPRQ